MVLSLNIENVAFFTSIAARAAHEEHCGQVKRQDGGNHPGKHGIFVGIHWHYEIDAGISRPELPPAWAALPISLCGPGDLHLGFGCGWERVIRQREWPRSVTWWHARLPAGLLEKGDTHYFPAWWKARSQVQCYEETTFKNTIQTRSRSYSFLVLPRHVPIGLQLPEKSC